VSPKYNAIELVFFIYKLLKYYRTLGHPLKLGGVLTILNRSVTLNIVINDKFLQYQHIGIIFTKTNFVR